MTDLISRRAAIKAIDDLPNCYNGYSDTYDKAYIIGTLEELPTIDPVKHGKWAYREKRDYPLAFDRVGCSICGWRFYSHPDEKDDQHRADRIATSYCYCPMCGARMDL